MHIGKSYIYIPTSIVPLFISIIKTFKFITLLYILYCTLEIYIIYLRFFLKKKLLLQ